MAYEGYYKGDPKGDWVTSSKDDFFSKEELAEYEAYRKDPASAKTSFASSAARRRASKGVEKWLGENYSGYKEDAAARKSKSKIDKRDWSRNVKEERREAIKRMMKEHGWKKSKAENNLRHWVISDKDGNAVMKYGSPSEYDASPQGKIMGEWRGADRDFQKATKDEEQYARRRKEETEGILKTMMRKYQPFTDTGRDRTKEMGGDAEKYDYYSNLLSKSYGGMTKGTFLGQGKKTDYVKNLLKEQGTEMNKGEAASMANPYEPSQFTSDNPYNTQATRDVSSGKSGLIGNAKAGDAVYNPQSKTRKTVRSAIDRKRKQKDEHALTQAKERIF